MSMGFCKSGFFARKSKRIAADKKSQEMKFQRLAKAAENKAKELVKLQEKMVVVANQIQMIDIHLSEIQKKAEQEISTQMKHSDKIMVDKHEVL
jgi:uncharacterized protein (DUF1501 family)